MDDLLIRLSNGTRIYTPPTLSAITTYVLLEQETWFEKEFSFLPHILKPGMTAIDIGANLGVYAAAMASLVGPAGKVFAYEPTSETRGRLERTRIVNGADNLTIVGKALSDGERTGTIVFGGSSELNHLGDDGPGEKVEVSSLDLEGERLGWGRPDFI
jgi:FkbM family methyltransferase